MGGDRVDFFVSHAGADRAWAEWVAWQLMDAGYSVELDVWDWAAGCNFVTAMSDALERADRVIGLISSAFLDRSRYTTNEWSASLVRVPGLREDRLIPLRVEDMPARAIPALLRPLVSHDLFGIAEEAARQVLLQAAAGPGRPDRSPGFPGGRTARAGRQDAPGPRLPGRMPEVWNIPARNAGFTGRDSLLTAVRDQLLSSDRAVVQALEGMGGVGKTQLAVEYAHRFAGVYDVAWWIAAEQPGLIGEQFILLAAELGCAEPGTAPEVMRRAVMASLRRKGMWLLLFDNANIPEDLIGWLPGGDGHVLITSRAREWTEIGAAVEVDVLARPESVSILVSRVPDLALSDAMRLAAALGDLPLAVTQTAQYLASTGMPARTFLQLLDTHAIDLLAMGKPVSYPRSLAAATLLTAERLARDDQAASDLVSICAFMAPAPIPAAWFTVAAKQLPGRLARCAADPMRWREVLAHLGHSSLARIERDSIQLHRLTQAVLRDRLLPDQAAATRACAEVILAASNPGSPDDPGSWMSWAPFMPHLLTAISPVASNPLLREAACEAAEYLLRRGDSLSSHDLALRLFQQWSDQLGRDSSYTLKAASVAASALRELGRHSAARDLDQDTLDRRRRVLGPDHSDTLVSAADLAVNLRELGELHAAHDLDQDTLDRRRRILGGDHPDTLTSASNLAIDLYVLGDLQSARALDQDIYYRRRRVLGEDHPHTLTSASNLAADLAELGEAQAARDLHQDTLDRRRRLLGDDHPRTLTSASNLAADWRRLGDLNAALDLDRDTLDRRRRVLGENHPGTLTSASNLAIDLRELGELRAARDLDRDTLDRRRRVLGQNHPDTLTSATNLAADLRGLGELRAALDLDQDTLDRRRRVLGENHPHTLISASNFADDLRALREA